MIKRILIVDDDQFIRSLLSKAIYNLFDFQGEIKVVENGKNAIKEISHDFYNICFLDIKLPDINGLYVMEMINKISPQTSIAIMSGSYITEDMKRKIEEGASIFFEKPFDLHQIGTFVRQIFEVKKIV